jgi:hypothetical protein
VLFRSPSGDFIVTAVFGEEVTLGIGEPNETVILPHYTTGYYDDTDVLLARYDASGDLVWARRATSGINCYKHPNDLAVGADGAIHLAIESSCNTMFGLDEPTETTIEGDGAAMMTIFAVFEANGDFRWAERPITSIRGYATGVAALSDGSLVASGRFMGFLGLNPGEDDEIVIGSIAQEDAFVARWSSTGEFMWVLRAGGNDADAYEQGGQIAVGPDDTVFLAGSYGGIATFGSGGTVPAIDGLGGTDAVASHCSADGLFDWAQGAGGALDDAGWTVGALPDGTYLMGGTFGGLARFPDGEGVRWLEGVGVTDIYVARIRPPL